jgi:hypothetical protein
MEMQGRKWLGRTAAAAVLFVILGTVAAVGASASTKAGPSGLMTDGKLVVGMNLHTRRRCTSRTASRPGTTSCC